MKCIYEVPDYEHYGDLEFSASYILEMIPEAKIISKEAVRDYEAEFDYEQEYGELDEYIYRGYITYIIPDKSINKIKNL